MFSNKIKLIIALILFTPIYMLPAHAALSSFANFLTQNHLIVEGGWFVAHQGKSQHIGINTLIGDHFSVSKHNDSNGLFGVGYYLDAGDFHRYAIQYGIQGYYLLDTEVKGKVSKENTFINLSYRYDTTHFPLYIAGKGLLDICPGQQMTATLGLGINFIKTGDFKENSLDGITLPDHPFNSRRQTRFSAMFGLGWRFDHAIRQFPVEISYRFFYLNEGQFGKRYQVLNGLKTGQIYVNALTISIATA